MFTFDEVILGLVLWVCFARVFAGLGVCFGYILFVLVFGV